MQAVERRPYERALHESFLVVRTAPGDVGHRPLTGPFISPDLTVGQDGHPRVVVWNLGRKEVCGAVADFYNVPAGKRVLPENMQKLGQSIPGIVEPNNCITLTCPSIWARTSSGDILLAAVYHPELDPVYSLGDPVVDRHMAQMNYAWAGRYEGTVAEDQEREILFDVRPANGKLYRLKSFLAENDRLPSHPQVDRIMAPMGNRFQWLETSTVKRDFWEVIIQNNQQLWFRCTTRYLDNSCRQEERFEGFVERK